MMGRMNYGTVGVDTNRDGITDFNLAPGQTAGVDVNRDGIADYMVSNNMRTIPGPMIGSRPVTFMGPATSMAPPATSYAPPRTSYASPAYGPPTTAYAAPMSSIAPTSYRMMVDSYAPRQTLMAPISMPPPPPQKKFEHPKTTYTIGVHGEREPAPYGCISNTRDVPHNYVNQHDNHPASMVEDTPYTEYVTPRELDALRSREKSRQKQKNAQGTSEQDLPVSYVHHANTPMQTSMPPMNLLPIQSMPAPGQVQHMYNSAVNGYYAQ